MKVTANRRFLGVLLVLAALRAAPAGAAPKSLTKAEREARLQPIRAALAKHLQFLERRLTNNPGAKFPTRELVNAALFSIVESGAVDKAERFLKPVLAAQDVDPHSPHFGGLPFILGDASPVDENATEYATEAFGPIMLASPDRLTPAFKAEMEGHLRACVAALRRRHFDVPTYTDVYLRKVVNLLLIGQVLGDDKAIAEAKVELERWVEYTRSAGIHQFDSPVSYTGDLNTLGLGYLYATSPELKTRFGAILEYFWTDIAANFFPARESLSGPFSRARDFLSAAGGIDFYLYGEGFRGSLGPEPMDLERVYLLLTLGEKGYHPGDGVFAAASIPTRIVKQRWDVDPAADRYNYVTPDFALGSAGADFGPQDLLVSLTLASAKALPLLSIIPDASDDPYGQDKDQFGRPRLHHVPLHPVTVQDKGDLLVLLDLDPTEAASPKGVQKGLVTNVILPAAADGLYLDGKKVTLERNLETEVKKDAVIGVREGRAGVAIRILSADGVSKPASMALRADAEGLALGAARLAVYHTRDAVPNRQDHVRAAFLVLAARCATDGDFDALQARAASAKIVEHREAERWAVQASVGSTVLEAARDLAKDRPATRRVNGYAIQAVPLSINDKEVRLEGAKGGS